MADGCAGAQVVAVAVRARPRGRGGDEGPARAARPLKGEGSVLKRLLSSLSFERVWRAPTIAVRAWRTVCKSVQPIALAST